MLKNSVRYKKSDISLAICMGGLLLMFMMEAWGGISPNEYLHTLWIAFFACIMPYHQILYLLTALMPLCSLTTHFAHVFLALFVIIMYRRVLLKRGGAVNECVFVIIGLFACLELFAHFYYGVSVLNKSIGYISTIAIFFWLLYERDHGDYKKHLRIYIFAVFALCLLTFINTAISYDGNWLVDFFSGGMRLGGTAESEFNDTDIKVNANALAYYSISAIGCYLAMWGISKPAQTFTKIFDIIQIAVIVLIGLMTVSRSWLLVFALVLFIFFFARARANKNANRTVALLGIITVLVFVLINSPIIDMFMARFDEEGVQTAGGRTEIMADYFEAFFSRFEYIVFGTGVSDYSRVVNMTWSMHNATQQILVCLGLPAAILFVVAMFRPINIARKNRKILMQQWLPLVAIGIFVQTIQFLNPNILMLPFVVAFYAIKISDSSNID